MLSSEKLKEVSLQRQIDIEQLAKSLVKAGRNHKQAVAAVKNWQKGLKRATKKQKTGWNRARHTTRL